MLKIRNVILVLGVLMSPLASAATQVSIGIGLPHVSIGINLPAYPRLVAVPGYPVYYAPQLEANFFFYDGMYWVYQDDDWYASTWYNGPWGVVGRADVPVFILQIPVRYYRRPPAYFQGWRPDAAPRWVITGDMIGNKAEAIGTTRTTALLRHLPRCLPTSVIIQEIGIPDRWSSSIRFSSRNTVTSRMTP